MQKTECKTTIMFHGGSLYSFECLESDAKVLRNNVEKLMRRKFSSTIFTLNFPHNESIVFDAKKILFVRIEPIKERK